MVDPAYVIAENVRFSRIILACFRDLECNYRDVVVGVCDVVDVGDFCVKRFYSVLDDFVIDSGEQVVVNSPEFGT